MTSNDSIPNPDIDESYFVMYHRIQVLSADCRLNFRYAYVEFLEVEAVQNAILLSESELHNRPLKVSSCPSSGLLHLHCQQSNQFLRRLGIIFQQMVGLYWQVTAKRTNVPGMKGYRGRPYAPYYGYRPRRPFSAPYGYAPYGSGWSSLVDSILTCGVHIS